MAFYIRFKSQLRRTRPELIAALEGEVVRAASAAGGSTETGRKVLTASFDENRMGFWLDMVIFLERVAKALEEASLELYGYVLALGRDIPEASIVKLCRPPPERGARRGTGIWCSQEVCRALGYYVVFGSGGTLCPRPSQTGDEGEPPDSERYRELQEWRTFDEKKKPPARDYSAKIFTDTPVLNVRFGAAGCALLCFADAYTPQIRPFIAGAVSKDTIEELDMAHSLLFRERLRQELPVYVMERTKRFIRSLLTAYIAAVRAKSARGTIVMEALHLADAAAAKNFREVYASLGEKKKFLVLAAGNSTAKSLKNWGGVLNQTIINAYDNSPLSKKVELSREIIPREILEVSYNILILGQYFPDYLFPQLFEEQGLNREMYSRSLTMLRSLGMLAGGHSTSVMPALTFRDEKALGARKEKIRTAVRNIILAWVEAGRLRPCFNLLNVLVELGGRATDDLILRAIRADVLNGTPEGIEKSIRKERFVSLVGDWNVPVLTYIYKTLRALAAGEKDDIQEAFGEPVPSMTRKDTKSWYEAYQAQAQINLAAFYIGTRSSAAASEAVRKAMFLNRDLGKNAVPANRLFSLVHLSQQRIDDAQEYISFALEQAETMEQNEELALTCYFASSISFLHGNLSRAQRLAMKAEETAVAFGQAGWAMRATFLRGKICFEIGRYSDALEIFESLHDTITAGVIPCPPLMSATVRAWIYRAKVFIGRFPPPGDLALTGNDGKLFEIEAAYFAADYERAKTLAERFLSLPDEKAQELYSGKDFLFTEQPDWRSGFAQCEDILFSGKTQGARIAWIYRAMAHCALHPSREAKAGILGSMQRFMRDELLPDTDPNDAFYFYAWYCMLHDTDAEHIDTNMVVSMAYKRLQRRAGKIDDMKTRRTFLTLSRWGNTLNLAAREYKLV
ncbi:MAG: hypothetical protein FWC64_11255 [Treponema sp.]|nr:hypothetical protein [Treponema sp.]